MVGRFESPLLLHHNMQTMEACGPVLWDLPLDAQLSVKVHVRITQNGKTVNGNSKAIRFSPPDDEWMFFMDTHGDLKPGQAFAEARAVDKAGNELVRWDQLVQLEVEVTRKVVKRLIADSQEHGPLADEGTSPPAEEWPKLTEREWPPDDDDYDAGVEVAASAEARR
jgi:hypothetical protein